MLLEIFLKLEKIVYSQVTQKNSNTLRLMDLNFLFEHFDMLRLCLNMMQLIGIFHLHKKTTKDCINSNHNFFTATHKKILYVSEWGLERAEDLSQSVLCNFLIHPIKKNSFKNILQCVAIQRVKHSKSS